MYHRFKHTAARALSRVWGWRHLFPLTPLGAAVAAGGYWLSFHHGPQTMDRVLLAGGLLALGVVGLSVAAVWVGGVSLWLAARRATAQGEFRLETGATTTTGLRLPSLEWLPLIQVELLWEDPAEVEVSLQRTYGRYHELIRPLRRGEVQRVVRRYLVSDLFGFCRFGLARASGDYLYIKPAALRVTAHVMTHLSGGDYLSHPDGRPEGELIEMRRYVHGDPLRHVLWKAFARTRKLLVRTAEVAINPRPSAAAYLVAGRGDEPAASAARFFVDQGLLGEQFIFGADGAGAAADNPEGALEQIIASADHRGSGAEGLAPFLARLDRARRANTVLFVPPTPGRWLSRVERAAAGIPGARVVTAVDAHPATGAPGKLHSLLFADGGTEQRAARQLRAVVARLAAKGLDVNVVHRPSGELLTRAQLEALAATR